jgi:hypothetical protein
MLVSGEQSEPTSKTPTQKRFFMNQREELFRVILVKRIH